MRCESVCVCVPFCPPPKIKFQNLTPFHFCPFEILNLVLLRHIAVTVVHKNQIQITRQIFNNFFLLSLLLFVTLLFHSPSLTLSASWHVKTVCHERRELYFIMSTIHTINKQINESTKQSKISVNMKTIELYVNVNGCVCVCIFTVVIKTFNSFTCNA